MYIHHIKTFASAHTRAHLLRDLVATQQSDGDAQQTDDGALDETSMRRRVDDQLVDVIAQRLPERRHAVSATISRTDIKQLSNMQALHA